MGLGNAVVGYLTGSAFLFGAAAVGSVTVLVLFALAALSTVAREIMKGVEDMEGDREEGLIVVKTNLYQSNTSRCSAR